MSYVLEGGTSTHMIDAVVMDKSVNDTNSSFDRVILVAPGTTALKPSALVRELWHDVNTVPPLVGYGHTWTSLRAWELAQYHTVVLAAAGVCFARHGMVVSGSARSRGVVCCRRRLGSRRVLDRQVRVTC